VFIYEEEEDTYRRRIHTLVVQMAVPSPMCSYMRRRRIHTLVVQMAVPSPMCSYMRRRRIHTLVVQMAVHGLRFKFGGKNLKTG